MLHLQDTFTIKLLRLKYERIEVLGSKENLPIEDHGHFQQNSSNVFLEIFRIEMSFFNFEPTTIAPWKSSALLGIVL